MNQPSIAIANWGRRGVTIALTLLGLLCLTGCPGSAPAVVDPGSDAAELEGRWCLTGEEDGFFGFFRLDETGDPFELEDNPIARDNLQVDVLILDGRSHSTDSGAQYTAIASATLDGTDVELYVELHVFTFGFEVGALAMKFEGQRVGAETLEGIAVTIQDFPQADAPDLIIQKAGATKNTCE